MLAEREGSILKKPMDWKMPDREVRYPGVAELREWAEGNPNLTLKGANGEEAVGLKPGDPRVYKGKYGWLDRVITFYPTDQESGEPLDLDGQYPSYIMVGQRGLVNGAYQDIMRVDIRAQVLLGNPRDNFGLIYRTDGFNKWYRQRGVVWGDGENLNWLPRGGNISVRDELTLSHIKDIVTKR